MEQATHALSKRLLENSGAVVSQTAMPFLYFQKNSVQSVLASKIIAYECTSLGR